MLNKVVVLIGAMLFSLVALPQVSFALGGLEGLPYEFGFQDPVTPVAREMQTFHNMLLWIISGITVFVFLLLVFVALRFNEKTNPKPSQTTHNVPLEVIWTLVPVLILLVIAIPSFRLLYFSDRVANPDLTVKVTGLQWYWTVEYPDNGGISFDTRMIPSDEIDTSKGQKRLLSVDNPMVLPVDTNIQFDITAADVLHSFAIPAFGIKKDAVPGRMNQTWARVEKEGTYFGQCSELCGKDHAFMPMEVRVVSKEAFALWVEEQKKDL